MLLFHASSAHSSIPLSLSTSPISPFLSSGRPGMGNRDGLSIEMYSSFCQNQIHRMQKLGMIGTWRQEIRTSFLLQSQNFDIEIFN